MPSRDGVLLTEIEHPLLILVSDNWGIGRNIARTEVDSSRRSAWAFTRLSNIGYPQYLRNVDEVNCPRFLCIYQQYNPFNERTLFT